MMLWKMKDSGSIVFWKKLRGKVMLGITDEQMAEISRRLTFEADKGFRIDFDAFDWDGALFAPSYLHACYLIVESSTRQELRMITSSRDPKWNDTTAFVKSFALTNDVERYLERARIRGVNSKIYAQGDTKQLYDEIAGE